MVEFDKFVLDNGLKVIVHEDNTTPIVAVNILYDVGAKDEHPDKTGFAHLFEHLMFGGSLNIPSYDIPLQRAGGENNAFTNNDITNYYLTVPKENIETAFWLESDRMISLAFTPQSLNVQRNVVIEEYKQRYLNQPYGDVWLLLRPLVYKKHPYQWDTIGKNISHIEKATLKDVKEFFFKYYAPNNAVLVVAGDIKTGKIKDLAEKWFSPVERRNVPERNLPEEPQQQSERKKTVERDVPFDCILKAYHMCPRKDKKFYTIDLISDILSNGKSARLYQSLVKDKKIFSTIDAYLTGSVEDGLFIITGKLFEGKKIEEGEDAINEELDIMKNSIVSDYELNKVKNKIESNLVLSEMNILNKAMNLAFHELLEDAGNINIEIDKYKDVPAEHIHQMASTMFKSDNCSTLYYMAK